MDRNRRERERKREGERERERERDRGREREDVERLLVKENVMEFWHNLISDVLCEVVKY